ncbi:TPA: hypothetical protein ACU2IW_002409 [Staphylococcus aureus]|uniref:hypothetical protein n=1 Tax=Staphylococcus aureus TaxID=1280 RepID=UPI00215CB205|nr:hypothetical protein [Staphylococcus aureus]UVI81937.1 hypothetical protein NW967_11145 [Staphylococcus aureus]UVI87089.1 hypothetical protein NW951_11360 [Staphylococcus aureus]UVI92140.1 hypothetical protein NW981_10875 [Staphylococcus aureus]UVJ11668.1 hypothetical protein NW941_05450 [Staphylococcus aureus]UVJ20516.1 hypothetical protein NW983_11450 [Staphylococcus aureus]
MTVVKIQTVTGRVYYATTNLTFEKYVENISSFEVRCIRANDTLNKTSWVKTDAIEAITLIEESEDD